MSATYKSEGIILRRVDFREQDRLVTCMTKEYGKITARAISVKKEKAKLAGHIEPYTLAELFFAKSKTIDILAGSVIIESHAQIRQSLPHIASVGFFFDILDAFIEPMDQDTQLYAHMKETLQWMNTHSMHSSIVYAALLQAMNMLGHHIEWYLCHQCKKPITPIGAKFHYDLWSVECGDCDNGDYTIPLSVNAIKGLRFMNQYSYDDIMKVSFSNSVWSEIDTVIRSLFRYHIDSTLSAESVFLQLLAPINR